MTTIFRKAQIDRDKLRDVILKNPGDIQSELGFIDFQFGTAEEGVIDFLGVDSTGRLVIINFDTKENDELLVTALSQMRWLKKNENLVKRVFFSENVDFNQDPLILLICPGFSRKLISAAKELSGHDLRFVQFQYVISDAQDAILFEDIFSQQKPEIEDLPMQNIESLKPPTILEEVKVTDNSIVDTTVELTEISPEQEEIISLTQQEIAEFMDFDKILEEKQTSD
ncbi:MAG: hypothetical protein GY853_04390 [PVC group bacterium]|nr:hypothetical protein [PVC group bacterium]